MPAVEIVLSFVLLGAFVMYLMGIPGSLLVTFIASWVASGSFGEAIGTTIGIWFVFFLASLVVPWFLVLVFSVIGISAEGLERLKRFGNERRRGKREHTTSVKPPPLPERPVLPPLPKTRGSDWESGRQSSTGASNDPSSRGLEADVEYCRKCRAILRQWAKECVRCGTPRQEFAD